MSKKITSIPSTVEEMLIFFVTTFVFYPYWSLKYSPNIVSFLLYLADWQDVIDEN